MKQWILRTTPRRLRLLVVMTSLVAAASWSLVGGATSLPVQAQPAVPVPVVLDAHVYEWSVGAGPAYWAYNCVGVEFPSGISAELFRIPTAGGPQATLASQDASSCITFADQISTADGVYYYNGGQGRIERRVSTNVTPVKEIANDLAPFKSPLEDGDYLYWAAGLNTKILRVRKDGGGEVETVADTTTLPLDVMVVGNIVYWTDHTDVWLTSIACDNLPCTDTRQQFAELGAKDTGYGLAFQELPKSPGQSDSYRVVMNPRTRTHR